MQIGNVSSRPGELTKGYLDVADLPTGQQEQVPVFIAEGEEDGPTLWIVATIHGEEVTPLATCHDLMTQDLAERISGRVVCMPNINPAGLRQDARTSYYNDHDPNRYWPDPYDQETERPPKLQERINQRIYDEITDTADALISFHSAHVNAVPYVVRPRVPYGYRRTQAEAEALAEELDELVNAFGIPILQYEENEYRERNLRRTTAGSLLEKAGIPAFTPEMGTTAGMVIEENREAGVIGVQNVMREMGILDGKIVPNDVTPDAPVDFPCKRPVDPVTDRAGIVRHRVDAGDEIEQGDPVADIVSPLGEHKTTIYSDHDGWVIARHQSPATRIAVYEGDPLIHTAVRDDGQLIREAPVQKEGVRTRG
ncbi:succinylglutamate desuccinylase/aspartoacylase family protein [Halorussus sp. AFM4]|uniref:succinylglutamate desuccinylase/aspartoacylase family protein n=1 Tax=Halorussus sp. AFM4 TaxID=3421651 RepID=UPI003EBF9F8E